MSGEKFVFRRKGSMAGSPLELAIEGLGKADYRALAPLASRFEATRQAHGQDREWLLRAVIRFVQEIPYETITEDAMGLRPPLAVLHEFGGDCDSKSLLAAALLSYLGWKTAVISNSGRRHAVLGVVTDLLSGTSISEGRATYVMTEMTAVRAPGDMSGSDLDSGANPRSKGWTVRSVEQP